MDSVKIDDRYAQLTRGAFIINEILRNPHFSSPSLHKHTVKGYVRFRDMNPFRKKLSCSKFSLLWQHKTHAVQFTYLSFVGRDSLFLGCNSLFCCFFTFFILRSRRFRLGFTTSWSSTFRSWCTWCLIRTAGLWFCARRGGNLWWRCHFTSFSCRGCGTMCWIEV